MNYEKMKYLIAFKEGFVLMGTLILKVSILFLFFLVVNFTMLYIVEKLNYYSITVIVLIFPVLTGIYYVIKEIKSTH